MSDDAETPKSKPKKQPTGDYASGYCRPPSDGRWVKGQPSPNPRGRPPKSKRPDAIVDRVSTSLIEVVDGGKRRKVSKYEALAIKMFNDAVKGDRRAAAAILHTRCNYMRLPPPEESEPAEHPSATPGSRASAKQRADEGRRAIFDRVASRQIPVRDNGIQTRMPIEEALWQILYADSLKGDAKAMALVMRFQDKIGIRGVEPRRNGADDVEYTLSLGERTVVGDDTQQHSAEFFYED